MFHVFIHSLKSYNARFILKSSNTYKKISFEIFYIFYFKKEKKKTYEFNSYQKYS